MNPADAVLGLFLRVPEVVRECTIDGMDMKEQPYIVYSTLAAFVGREVLNGRGGLDAPVERVGAYIEDLVASGNPDVVNLIRFSFLHALTIELGSAAVDLAFIGPKTRRLMREDEPPTAT